MSEVVISVGATGALFTTCQALIQPGDEFVVIEPAFDCYSPQAQMAGAKIVVSTMKIGRGANGRLDYQLDLADLATKINSKTRAVLINTVCNQSNHINSIISIQSLI